MDAAFRLHALPQVHTRMQRRRAGPRRNPRSRHGQRTAPNSAASIVSCRCGAILIRRVLIAQAGSNIPSTQAGNATNSNFPHAFYGMRKDIRRCCNRLQITFQNTETTKYFTAKSIVYTISNALKPPHPCITLTFQMSRKFPNGAKHRSHLQSFKMKNPVNITPTAYKSASRFICFKQTPFYLTVLQLRFPHLHIAATPSIEPRRRPSSRPIFPVLRVRPRFFVD
ncbi:hypothetical protein G3N57_27875 [Paraburkholderia sp. Se-20369]|nr:hypothetical protein [Paraburkholderia sp. Se-20369]